MLHTQSSNGEFETCERRFWIKHIQMVRPVIKGASLNIGTLFHKGLECLYKGKTIEQAIDAINELAASNEFFNTDDGAIELRRVKAMLRAYNTQWGNDYYCKIIDIEREFKFEIAPGVWFAGVFDLVYQDNNQLYLVDHKTTSEEIANVGTDFWQRLAIDKQIVSYSEALKREYGKIPTIVWDVCRKPSGKPKMKERIVRRKVETELEYEARKAASLESLDEFEVRLYNEMIASPDEYLVRRVVHRTKEQHESLLEEVIETCKRIDAHTGPWVRNDRACQSRFGACQFLGVCAGIESLDSERFEKLETANPELTNNKGGLDESNDCPI